MIPTIDVQHLNVIDLIEPELDQISIEDIARGLAFKGHFGGHTPFYFSIAEHSLLVCEFFICEDEEINKYALEALLHDSAEAYVGDLLSPLKKYLPEFKKIEKNILKKIFEKFNLDYDFVQSDILKIGDYFTLAYEYFKFFPGRENPFIPALKELDFYTNDFKREIDIVNYGFNGNLIEYMIPCEAKARFLEKFNSLYKI